MRRVGPAGRALGSRLARAATGSRTSVSGRARVSAVKRSAILLEGRSSTSLSNVTSTGVAAAAIGVPEAHMRDTAIAATAEATLAMTSVRRSRRFASPRSVRACEDMIPTG